MRSHFILLLFWICLCGNLPAAAAVPAFPHYLSSEQSIGDDVYMMGEEVAVKGKVIGDLFALGKTVSCGGAVAADLFCAGLQIEAAGTVNDDLRAVGLYTDFSAHVGDDALLAGFKVNIGPDSRIGHTALVAAGQATINGLIQGDLIVTGYNCILGGNIQGNVTASAAKLQLTPATRIKGSLVYTSREPVIIPPGAVIEGEIIHHKPAAPKETSAFAREENKKWLKLIGMATWDAGLIIIGLGLMLLVPQTIQTPSRTMANKPWLACMYGFLWLVGAPVTASVGIISIIGLPLSIAIVFLYLSSLYLSSLPVALWVGQKLFQTPHKPCLSLVLGLLAISLLRSLPYIGFIAGTIVLTVGLGSLALSLRNYLRNLQS